MVLLYYVEDEDVDEAQPPVVQLSQHLFNVGDGPVSGILVFRFH